MAHTPRRERLIRAGLFAASVLAALGAVVTIEAAIRLTDPELMVRRRGLQRYHPRLGWENRPHARSSNAGITVSLDQRGHRLSGNPLDPRARPARLILLGDSVAFGLGVSDDDTFAASLGQGTPPYSVTNLAVPGYGPGQSLLAYEGIREPQDAAVVIFALCLGNDLADVMSDSHLYEEGIPKPRFLLRQGSLVLEGAHVGRAWIRGLFDRSFLFARLGPPAENSEGRPEQTERRRRALRGHSPEAEDTLLAILQRMRQSAERRGARFLIVAFPDERTLDPASIRWPRLREKLEPRFALLDVVPLLARDEDWYKGNTLDHIGHLSKRGHEQAARALRERLALLKERPTTPSEGQRSAPNRLTSPS